MKLSRIIVGGFANIDMADLSFSSICALLARNNYGKSNVLSAIIFGLNYIKVDAQEKWRVMTSNLNFIPINKAIAGKDYLFRIEGDIVIGGKKSSVIYEYSFVWPQQEVVPHISSEYLKIKREGETKYSSYIKRENNHCSYLSSVSGRCSSALKIDISQLALNKLSNYDDLFYIDELNDILNLNIVETQSLADPKTFFRTLSFTDGRAAFSGDINNIPDFASSAYYVYNLKKSNPNKYNLFRDAVIHLIPSIVDFEPVKVDLKKQVTRLNGEKNIPFHLPEFIYDIRVKERNLNQQVAIERLSSGTKRIFYILLMTIAAELNKIPLILIEELENSIHPSLFQSLLSTLKNLSGDTQIVLTSHSPYLLQYINPELLYLGIPNELDVATFKKIRRSKIKSLMREASMCDMSLGDYLFDMLQDIQNTTDEVVTKYFE